MENSETSLLIQNKRLIWITLIVALLLLIPLIAMQFTDEVNWNLDDFIVAGILLLGTGLSIDLVIRKVKNINYRIFFTFAIILALLFIWIELAVGIFS